MSAAARRARLLRACSSTDGTVEPREIADAIAKALPSAPRRRVTFTQWPPPPQQQQAAAS